MITNKPKRVLLIAPDAVDDTRSFSERMADDLCQQGEIRFVEQSKYCYFEAEAVARSLDRILCGIEQESVYSNHYEGLIAIDMSALESSAGEYYVETFLSKLKKLNDKAAFLFFATPNGRIANSLSRHFTKIENDYEYRRYL